MDKKTVITQDLSDLLSRYVARIREAGIPIEKVILFGSHARGTAKPESDIDLCVVSSQFGRDYHTSMVQLRILLSDIDRAVDVVPYTPEDLLDKYDPLAHEIRRYGIPVL
ncbi:MAG: nucleotidyltransferase [Microgenomates group bacterium GW2011_GWC1_43_11]|nr:MAG: nucleotidyltransferase [Microgenomates group bacterium GW2011_GWC1_43_11]HCM81859.1 nucleotidyltransferase domain-containing protein [Patescibacteria group bacterium]